MSDGPLWRDKPLRVLLLTPGNHERRVAKAIASDADAAVLDLEDAVAAGEKASARVAVEQAVRGAPAPDAVCVRTNAFPTREFDDDLRAVVASGAGCALVPKVDDARVVAAIDARLSALEREHGRAAGEVALIPVVETPIAVVNCEAIALSAPPRVLTLQFGSVDMSLSLGLDLEANDEQLRYVRSRIVVAARAGGLRAPLDGGFLGDIADVRGVEADSAASRRMGFGGRGVIHPSHVAPALAGYTALSPELERWARQVVEEFERAEANGVAAVKVGGRMVDYPIYRWALERLQLQRGSDGR
ncbi:MAG TPA: CoA ester lyase [Conexibacter sp.]|jgi:citrate lyase subunit beta/citryl-CoA lyase|nr:CoA ester lyase [Conexibacter sp.]